MDLFSDALTNADWIAEGGFANKNDGLNPACIAQNPTSSNCTAADTFPAVNSGFNHAYDFPLAAMMGIESEVMAYSTTKSERREVPSLAKVCRLSAIGQP